MNRKILVAVGLMLATSGVRAQQQTPAPPDISRFYNCTWGQYQVLAQGNYATAWQVNQFMNQMLSQYSRYFYNWFLKPGARVIVFTNPNDFLAYAAGIAPMHNGLAGYCHLKTDEAGNTFYELVTFEQDTMWQVLAHEGFHQFLGYDMGLEVPTWLNEGLAQYFETSYVGNGRLHTGLVDKNKLRATKYLILSKRAPAVPEMLEMDRATFYANAQATYPMSWALVYYLMMRDNHDFGSSDFRHYLQDLKSSRDEIASFQRRFGRDSSQWERDFVRYILRLQPPTE